MEGKAQRLCDGGLLFPQSACLWRRCVVLQLGSIGGLRHDSPLIPPFLANRGCFAHIYDELFYRRFCFDDSPRLGVLEIGIPP